MANKLSTYSYSQKYSPAAPVVEARLKAPGRAEVSRSFTALIDSGADGTLLPIDLLEEIGARFEYEATLRGVTGESRAVDIYVADITIGGHTIPVVRMIAGSEGIEPILGRNVLNQFVITLNGLAGVTEIAA